VLDATLVGYQDGASITRLLEAVRGALQGRKARAIVFDTTQMDGFSPTVRSPGVELLTLVKSSGAGRGVAIATSAGVRMMGAAIAFAAGLPLEFVETRALAEARLAQTPGRP
jgi:ABC-type cobalamin transport system ATPase subunit